MRCLLRIPAAKFAALCQSWDGAVYRYALPPGDSVWTREAPVHVNVPPEPPVVETFALPPPVAASCVAKPKAVGPTKITSR